MAIEFACYIPIPIPISSDCRNSSVWKAKTNCSLSFGFKGRTLCIRNSKSHDSHMIISQCMQSDGLYQSTGESHSVITNCQKAISLMKMHSRTLCGAIAASSLERSASQDRLRAQQKLKQQKKAKKKLRGTRPVSVSGGVNACDFLKDMSHYEDRDLRSLEETTSPVKKNFNVLKNVKQLQSSLKKDDLMWE